MGTSLQARGLAAGALPEEWLVARPADVSAVHAGFARAGAVVGLTCTFSLASSRLEGRVSTQRAALARDAVRLAREAGLEAVAGALGPTGLVRPRAPDRPPPRALSERYAEACAALAAAGADLLWLESQYDVAEALAALEAARAAGLPAVVTFASVAEDLSLPAGEPMAEALAALAAAGAAAVGVNCVPPSGALERLAAAVAGTLPVPLVAKPSPGLPGAVLPPEDFAARVAALARAGAAWVGGCCGAGERHVAAIAAALR
jgi:5-methyltetrahydrofolate--homocysteine methyltransferase